MTPDNADPADPAALETLTALGLLKQQLSLLSHTPYRAYNQYLNRNEPDAVATLRQLAVDAAKIAEQASELASKIEGRDITLAGPGKT